MKTLLFIAFNIVTGIVYSQNLQLNWVNTLNSDGSNYVYSTLLDNSNNLYVSGIFSDTVDFDPSSNVVSKISTFSSGDSYIAKYDSNGNLIWVKVFVGLVANSSAIMYSMHINSLDQLIVAGSLTGIVDLDPNAGVTAKSSQGVTDILIGAYSATGVLIWAKSIGGADSENALKMKVTSTDDILIAGSFNGTTDFDPSGATSNLTTTGNLDGFFAKYSFDGTFTWAKKVGSTNIDYIHDMAIDANDNISICGQFKGSADMNPDVGVNTITSNSGSYDMFIGYYDDSGNYMWAFPLGNSDSDVARCIDFDNNNNVIISGGFRGTVDFDPSPSTFNLTSNPATTGSDIVVTRYSPSGSFINAFSFGGTNTDTPQSLKFINNQIQLLGYYFYDIDFDPSIGQQNYTAIKTAWFLSNYELDGTFNDVLVLGDNNSTQDIASYDFEVDANANLYLTGQYRDLSTPIDFNPNGTSVTMPYDSGWDGFIAKYSACTNTSSTDNIVACDSYTWIDGITYNASNSTATHTLTNVAGCDSIITLDLTINNSTSSSQTITACDSYMWPLNSSTYNTSGAYTHVIPNATGCDSTITLNLTINNSTTGFDAVSACDSYTWINGVTYTASNFGATHVLTNSVGCDSTVYLNLAINYSSSGSQTIIECDSYTWSTNGATYNASGVYSEVLTNSVGCDSTVTLNLTINNSTSGSANITACDSYTWSANGTNYTASGVYTAILTNATGCDSTATLNLTINDSYSTTENITICNSDTYTLPSGNVVNSNGSYNSFLTSVSGCDSTIITNLTVFNPNIGITSNDTTLTSSASSVTYQWIHCNNGNDLIPGATSSTYTPTYDGTFGVIITENGCVDTSACILIKVANWGIDEVNHNSFNIYPNPAHDKVNITGQNDESLIIRFVNLLGETVLITNNQHPIEFNIPAGSYFIIATDKNGNSTTQKLIIK